MAQTGFTTRALRGVPWSLLGYASSRAISLLGTLVLARLLSPSDFGVVLTGMVVVFALNILSEGGFGAAIMLREELDDRYLGTLFTLMALTGVTLAALAAACSGLLADLFGLPRLAEVMPFLAVAVIFATIAYFYMGLLQRELQFSRRFLGQLALAVTYVAVAVPAALLGAGIWSLVAGMVCGNVAFALTLWRLARTPVRPAFNRADASEAYRVARPFVTQASTEFLNGNIHFIAVSGVLGARAMGLYSMAFRLTELPAIGVATPVAVTTFPAFARMDRGDSERPRAFVTSFVYVLLVALPLMAGLAVLAPVLVPVVLGAKWVSMTPALTVLCAWGAFAAAAALLR